MCTKPCTASYRRASKLAQQADFLRGKTSSSRAAGASHGKQHGRTRRTLRLARKQAGEEPAPGPGRWLDIRSALCKAVRWLQHDLVSTYSSHTSHHGLHIRDTCHAYAHTHTAHRCSTNDGLQQLTALLRPHTADRMLAPCIQTFVRCGADRATPNPHLREERHCTMQTSAARVAAGSRRHHTTHAAAYVTVCQAEQALAPAPAARCLSCCAYCRNSSSASPTLASSGAPLVLAAKCLRRAAAGPSQVPSGLPVHSQHLGTGRSGKRTGPYRPADPRCGRPTPRSPSPPPRGLCTQHGGQSAPTDVTQRVQRRSQHARTASLGACSGQGARSAPAAVSKLLSSRVHLRTGRPPSPSPSYSTLQIVLAKVE